MKISINRNYLKLLFIFVTFLFCPAYAYANAGTPLMWAGFFHLLIGNFLIGIGEGTLIAFLFKVKKAFAIAIMILANYVSMVMGALFIQSPGNFLLQKILQAAPLYNAPKALIVMAIISFLITIIIEWPFCLWVLRKKPNRAKTSLYASFTVQVASYALIAPYYLLVSPISLYTNVEIDPSLSFANNQATIYYISSNGGYLCSARTNGSGIQKVLKNGTAESYPSSNHVLYFRLASNGNLMDLWGKFDGKEKLLMKGFTLQPSSLESNSKIDLRTDNKKYWEVRTGFWATEGLRANNNRTGESIGIAFDTPFISWPVRHATILPGDQVVFELGNQIVLLDMNKRKIGLIALGRGPVAVLDK